MNDKEFLTFATIEELAALLARREVSPVELTELFLGRIERHNPQLNAYLTITIEHALRGARVAENKFTRRRKSGGRHSPLLGIPIALKDNICTRGIRTTAGSRILRDFVPAEDATVARKLARAGAILLGKTHMHEFAYGITNSNEHYGPARNPWARDHISGGSSGGSSAAIAAGLCVASVGTDTGGSIRVPAAMCGIVGLKPTFGRIGTHGVVPLSPTLDHVGPLAHSVRDAAILLNALAGRDSLDPTAAARGSEDFTAPLRKPLRKFRLGRPGEYFWETLDEETRSLAEAAVRDLRKHGAAVSEISLPQIKSANESATRIALAEARQYHEAAGYFPARGGEYCKDVRQHLEEGANVRAVDYLAARKTQQILRAEFDAVFSGVDALVMPTVPFPAPPIGAERVTIEGRQINVRAALVGMNRPANFTGHPAISVPCGFTRAGLPVGLQLIGRAFDESTLLRIALVYERIHNWRERHPIL